MQKLVDGVPQASYSRLMAMRVEIGRAKFPDPKHPSKDVIYWDPSTTISGHAILVGSSGVGKTHRLRYLIEHLIRATRNINIHILDVHGDIAPRAENRVVFSEITDYGLNPLEVVTDPEFGGVRRRINSFVAMINRTTHKLGNRQEGVLRALLQEMYERNGYDARDPRTWNPRTNPRAAGVSKAFGVHPNISDLTHLTAWRTKNLLIGAGSKALRELNEVNKMAREEYLLNDDGSEALQALQEVGKSQKKLNRIRRKFDDGDEPALQLAKSNLKEMMCAYVDSIETGMELDEILNFDSLETLRAIYERLKAIESAGIFKDKPPVFSGSNPLRVYDIKALSEDEQSMFAEVLLERLFVEAKSRGQRDIPDTFIIIDEAHKFMSTDNEHIMNRMAREVRKFGVGLILVSQNFDHFSEDLIANSAMTMILGLHDMQHKKAETKLGLKAGSLKWIKPKQTALVQVRSGENSGLTNAFKPVTLPA